MTIGLCILSVGFVGCSVTGSLGIHKLYQWEEYVYLQSQQLMDIQQFISNDAEDFLNEHYQQQMLPIDLYDSHSDDEQSMCQLTVDETVQIMAAKLSITDMPISDAVEEALHAYNLNPLHIGQFARKIKKTKNIMKRRRAKNRMPCEEKSQTFEKKTFVFEESSTEKDTFVVEKEIKKQRNRISAQISRDKKKCYLNELETKNRQLALETEKLRLENERLRIEMEAQRSASGDRNKKQSNKLMKLLVFLGIIFFVYIVKDLFSSQSRKNDPSSLVDPNHQDECSEIPSVSSTQILNQINKQIKGLENEDCEIELPSVLPGRMGLRQTITRKIGDLTSKIKSFMLPGKLASSLLLSKGAFAL